MSGLFILRYSVLGLTYSNSVSLTTVCLILQFVFSSVSEIAGCDGEVVLHQTLPTGCVVGMELQGVWRSRLMLLGLTLELHAYLKGGCVQSCVYQSHEASVILAQSH